MAEKQEFNLLISFAYILLLVAILTLSSRLDQLEKYHIDALAVRQSISVETYLLPPHGYELGSQYQRTVSSPKSSLATPYKPEGMEWYRNDDNPNLYRRQQNLTYLFVPITMQLANAVLTSLPATATEIAG